MTVEQDITQFVGYFQEQVESIDALEAGGGGEAATDRARSKLRFYKKVLFITALDTLAGIRYAKKNYPQLHNKNRERFTRFLAESGIWPEGVLVSIPFIYQYHVAKLIDDGRLSALVAERYGGEAGDRDFSVPYQHIDLPLDELLAVSASEVEEKVVAEHQHYVLMYKYRNYLVHESREPGYAMEIGQDEEPYYHSYIGEPRLYLCYPIAHFRNLVTAAVGYIERHLRENELNPYDLVSDTSSW